MIHLKKIKNKKKIVKIQKTKNNILYNKNLDYNNEAPFLLNTKNIKYKLFNFNIISLMLKQIKHVINTVIHKKSNILVVGTSKISSSFMSKNLKENKNLFIINSKWMNGILTNWYTIKKRIEKIKELNLINNNSFRTKKDLIKNNKVIEKLIKNYGGLEKLQKMPDLVIFFELNKNICGLNECLSLGIPTIGITNSSRLFDKNLITFPIYINNNSISILNSLIKYFNYLLTK